MREVRKYGILCGEGGQGSVDEDSLADAESVGGRSDVEVVRATVALRLVQGARNRLGRLLETSREALVVLAEVDAAMSAQSTIRPLTQRRSGQRPRQREGREQRASWL